MSTTIAFQNRDNNPSFPVCLPPGSLRILAIPSGTLRMTLVCSKLAWMPGLAILLLASLLKGMPGRATLFKACLTNAVPLVHITTHSTGKLTIHRQSLWQ